ncbi:thiol reductant ABC exporter subunit CydD [Brevibacterium luteolum]|uniref:Thiol reductant ABC exporter subunit CydD n=1 Tax=Brevibacterium luteolum TaxID=199591 RepID=A0A6G8KUL5_9MICO|nr:thiol reductant ABC exporter subunit CydD [Brevibacterium luteolum]QIN28200.1 thiol reductant ABC exporter subunit CydD [Brevibacterium luteolum]
MTRTQRRSPVAIALAAPQGRRALWLLGLIAAAQALGLILVADGIARGIVAAMEGRPITMAAALGIIGALIRGLATWASKTAGARAAVGFKTTLRSRLVDRSLAGSGRDLPASDGALALTATRTLDDLDDYFTGVLPALLASALIPGLIIVRVLFTDWVSCLILILTLPLVPMFMILIGRYTENRVADATRALDQLSTNIVELARGLPVLLGLGRVTAQTAALRRMSTSYRATTMQTLRVAFISALALELIATISVAVVAVFIGVRLVYGHMGLEAGLFALILAPECFLPLRRLGAAFHSTENGVAAFDRVTEMTDRPVAERIGQESASEISQTAPAGAPITFDELSVAYASRQQPALPPLTAEVPSTGLTAVTGTSGSGKSTLLGVLAGLVRSTEAGECRITGSLTGVPARVAYAGQGPRMFEPTVIEELSLYAGRQLSAEEAAEISAAAALDVDPEMPCAALSPGEQRRLAIARVRAQGDAELILVDEPTAHLDAAAAAAVRQTLHRLARTRPVIAATHDSTLVSEADAHIRLTPASRPAVTDRSVPAPSAVGTTAGDAAAPASTRVTAPANEQTAVDAVPTGTLLRRLAAAVDMRSVKFWLAVFYGVAAVAAGAALTGVSAWLIVRASAQPPIMYLLVAIVGVRFFGLSRAVFTYLQRLALHDAVLRALIDLRERMWTDFARTGTANRTLLRGDIALTRFIADVDDIRDIAPRVVLPPVVALGVTIAAVGTLAVIAWEAALIMLAGGLLCLCAAPWVTLRADRAASSATLAARQRALGVLSRLLYAREDLIAAGRTEPAAAQFAHADTSAAAYESAAIRATGLGEGIITAVGVLTGIIMIPVLAGQVAVGELSGELLAVTVLLPLALIDAFADSLTAVQQWPGLARILARVDDLDPAGEEYRLATGVSPEEITQLTLSDVSARWPGTHSDVFTGLSAVLPGGGVAAVTGPSGSGKTTLVSVLLRFLDPRTGRYQLNDTDALACLPMDLAGRISWCPQEAHVFDSTLRANLLIARPREDKPSDAELLSALERVGLGELAADIGLDERIGAGGGHLSGGQRQRLAVARTLLADAEVVVLDEPTAHLDEEMAAALMADLRGGLAEELVVLVTHDSSLIAETDVPVQLAGRTPAHL